MSYKSTIAGALLATLCVAASSDTTVALATPDTCSCPIPAVSAFAIDNALSVQADVTAGSTYGIVVEGPAIAKKSTYDGISGKSLQNGVVVKAPNWPPGAYTVHVWGDCDGSCSHSVDMGSQKVNLEPGSGLPVASSSATATDNGRKVYRGGGGGHGGGGHSSGGHSSGGHAESHSSESSDSSESSPPSSSSSSKGSGSSDSSSSSSNNPGPAFADAPPDYATYKPAQGSKPGAVPVPPPPFATAPPDHASYKPTSPPSSGHTNTGGSNPLLAGRYPTPVPILPKPSNSSSASPSSGSESTSSGQKATGSNNPLLAARFPTPPPTFPQYSSAGESRNALYPLPVVIPPKDAPVSDCLVASASNISDSFFYNTGSAKITARCLASYEDQLFFLSFADSTGTTDLANFYNGTQLATGAVVDTTSLGSGTFNVALKGPCTPDKANDGGYQCKTAVKWQTTISQ